MKKTACISFLILIVLSSSAQDIQFSHINQTKLYLNPAFSGSDNKPHAILGHRNYAPSQFGDYISHHTSYNQYVDILNGGIGFQLINDRQGGGVINRIFTSAAYAYRFQVEKNITIQAALETKYAHLSIHRKNFIFPDMFNPTTWELRDSESYTSKMLEDASSDYLEFNTGVIMTYENFMIRKYREFTIGLSVHHLNQPQSLLTSDDNKIERRYNLYFDIVIPLMDKRSKGLIPILTPVFIFQKQGNNMNFNYGTYLTLSDFHLGVFFRHNYQIHYFNSIFYAGLNISNFRIGYSYDASMLSKMKKNPISGAHEVTLSISFQYKGEE
jgi:type IX secretion system PorP/SprF family membrane protein